MNASTRCQSRSRYGSCGRIGKHAGPHAVPIGGGVWFGYLRDRRVTPLGYGHLDGDTFEPIKQDSGRIEP